MAAVQSVDLLERLKSRRTRIEAELRQPKGNTNFDALNGQLTRLNQEIGRLQNPGVVGVQKPEATNDFASVASATRGGIDLNRKNLNLNIQQDKAMGPFNLRMWAR